MKFKNITGDVLFFFLLIFFFAITNCYGQESCILKSNNSTGECRNVKDCSSVLQQIRNGRRDYTICRITSREVLICCPQFIVTTTTTVTLDDVKSETSDSTPLYKRISEIKCHEYANYVYEISSTIPLIAGAGPKEVKIDRCGFKAVPLVVGGQMAKPQEFPHMALIGFGTGNAKQWACGGTLISEEYVLTAAHCLNTHLGPPKYVRLGELTIGEDDENDDPEEFIVTEILGHPKFKKTSKYDDIALLKLDRNVTFNRFKRPACLAKSYESNTRKVIATGWGRTKWAGKNSDTLQKVTLDKFNQTDCFNVYKQVAALQLPEGIKQVSQICAGSKTEKKDTCQGDSGGPLQTYHMDEYCMYEIVGVTSFGIMCGTPGIPGVYTRVHSYLDWIESIVWKSN